MICVLIVGSGAAWESSAVSHLNERPGITVVKRCVDVDDLLAAASAESADVAVVGLDTPGLDTAAVDHLRRHRVRPLAVAVGGVAEMDAARLRAARIGIPAVLDDDRVADLPELVETLHNDPDTLLPGEPAGAVSEPAPGRPDEDAPLPPPVPGGRIVAVWGPAGAPGRTTIAAGLAAEMAQRSIRTLLIDADPYGGTVAQQLGVLDEVSGLLSAARLAAGGNLPEAFTTIQRALGPHLTVVTGLPRADRWVELRAGTIEHVLETARDHGYAVVDTGFSLEEDPAGEFSGRPGRNAMTLGALQVADEIVVVGAADPIGLSRLARGLAELREVTEGAPVRIVVNRTRSALGWSEAEIGQLVSGFARVLGVHFLPDDPVTADKALVAGRTLVEIGPSPLSQAIGDVAEAMFPGSGEHAGRKRGRRRRKARV